MRSSSRGGLVSGRAPRSVTLGALAMFAFGPTADAAAPRHVIYLHGRIIQETQNARPRHPRFGHYELEKILTAFRGRGFEVSGEIRPKSASLSAAADDVIGRVRRLLESGVPPERVAVVGASMGAAIALLASSRMQRPEASFAVLGACMSRTVPELVDREGKAPAGRVLSIRESSDESSEPCPPWSERGDRLVVREIVLDTGLSHGFLYTPLPDWLNPVVEWVEGPGE